MEPVPAARNAIDRALGVARGQNASRRPQASLGHARALAFEVICAYWNELRATSREIKSWPLRQLPVEIELGDLPNEATLVAFDAGRMCADLDLSTASYLIGTLYTGAMPAALRADLGAYYTPTALCERLLDLAHEAGVDWRSARVIDPACGGGAFLSPVARRMSESMIGADPATILESIEERLVGLEVDPFAAWMSLVFLDLTLIDLYCLAGRRLRPLVRVENTLEATTDADGFDLVIGNPPYGRVTLSANLRDKFRRSLFGHANLYGVFTDLALRFCKPRGTIAYVTPTSFLAGAYFKALRALLSREAPPASIDFIADRKGVFGEVQQETALVVYRRGGKSKPAHVWFTAHESDGTIETTAAGTFVLPDDPESPWIIPRNRDQNLLVGRLNHIKSHLADYGYRVSTGPLVWNRHKENLRSDPGEDRFPLIWAESVRPDGLFEFRARQRAHQPYFEPRGDQQSLVTREPCVLLQRTTAKEQSRRLIAAELPAEFVVEHGGVVVENHLNVIKPLDGSPKASTKVLTALLNSDVVDQVFRCINGSVAVSAYELLALPLPPPESLHWLEALAQENAGGEELEREIQRLYGGALQ